ncbi:MAG: acyltransferase, partial [Actinomycetota bacterium]
RIYYGTDTRAAEFLVGALAAVVLAGRPMLMIPSRLKGWVGTVAAAGLIALCFRVSLDDLWVFQGGFALVALLSTVIVITCWSGAEPVTTLLSPRPIRYLGTISYGMYLYHWPIYLALTPERTDLSTWPLLGLRFAVTIERRSLIGVSIRWYEATAATKVTANLSPSSGQVDRSVRSG